MSGTLRLCYNPPCRLAGEADVVEKEQFTRSWHLSRFGYTLAGIGGRGTTNNLFWSVR